MVTMEYNSLRTIDTINLLILRRLKKKKYIQVMIKKVPIAERVWVRNKERIDKIIDQLSQSVE